MKTTTKKRKRKVELRVRKERGRETPNAQKIWTMQFLNHARTMGSSFSTPSSDINSPLTCILSRKQDTCGETNRPVFFPPNCSDFAILKATEPCWLIWRGG